MSAVQRQPATIQIGVDRIKHFLEPHPSIQMYAVQLQCHGLTKCNPDLTGPSTKDVQPDLIRPLTKDIQPDLMRQLNEAVQPNLMRPLTKAVQPDLMRPLPKTV